MCHGSALSKEVRKKSPVKTIGGTAEKSRGIGGKSPKNAIRLRLFSVFAPPRTPPNRLKMFGIFLNNSLIATLSG
jgi:hypothetical protein